jgi:hypothetical protein
MLFITASEAIYGIGMRVRGTSSGPGQPDPLQAWGAETQSDR